MSTAADQIDLQEFVPYLVNVLAARLSGSLAAAYAERFGITIPEWRVIAHLAVQKNISVREIHERVAMDKAKVSRAAARLESAGLVEKSINRQDRRLVELRLTAKGRKLYAAIVPLALDYEQAVMAVLPPQDRATFLRLVKTLLEAPAVKDAPIDGE